MIRQSKILWLILAIVLSTGIIYAQFAGGTGTEQDPYQVATAEHLDNVRNYLGSTHANKYFTQTADIDLGVAPWNLEEGWVPIGDDNYGNSFAGHYNGNGHIVTNLYINRPSGDYQGLFGYISGTGTINNLGLSNSFVSGGDSVGSLVGRNNYGSIINCYSSCNVSGAQYTGGLIGHNQGTITYCHSVAIVSGGEATGGLIGFHISGTITNCYSSGIVSGGEDTGGLVGDNRAKITKCYSIGNVSGESYYTGGLVGKSISAGTITNCYSSSNVSGGSYYTGGLVGHHSGTIRNCYSVGNVSGGSYVGGLVGSGSSSSIITNSYWNLQSSGQTSSYVGEGRYTAEMVYPSAVNTYVEWDWRIWTPDINYSVNSGYPYLRNPIELPQQAPEPAVAISPAHQAQSVLPSVLLNWSLSLTAENLETPTGFRLYLGTDNPPSNLVNGDSLGYTLSYEPIPDLSSNTTYYWQVVPYNQVGETQNCPIWSFTTYNPSMSISYPSGGELWMSGTTSTVRWAENSVPDVNLYISFDNGNQWVLIPAVDGSKGYYHFQVPSINSSQCRIKLENAQNSNEFAISNSFRISSSSNQPKVVLSYPSAAGLHLQAADTINITWNRQNVTSVALDWSADDGITWSVLASGIDANSYLWTVADAPGRNYRLRVRSELNENVLDISDHSFTISKIQVLTPNGGEIFTGDYSSTYRTPITWSAPGTAYVKIEYSANEGNSWTTIAPALEAGRGTVNWTIPGMPTAGGRIRISDVDNPAIHDISDASFSIRNPLKLINANDGGFISHQSLFQVRWQMQDIDYGSNMFWEYSADNSNWTRINSNAVSVNSENMFWYVNTGLVNTMWLRAVESGTNRIVGKSENPFRVTEKTLIVYEPNGGEEYPAQSTQTINWDYDGLTSLSLSYTYDDGASWNLIADSIPASNLSYTWLVPETPSINCRIKLQDETYNYMVLESDANFSISPLQVIDPTVDFTTDIQSSDIPLSVQFTETINPGVGSIASRLWNFGDGNTSEQISPLHIYSEAGSYTVSLTVTNDFGGSATETKVDYINALPNTPRIELLSDSTLNYGTIYPGVSSEPQVIEVKNTGTIALNIASVSYYLSDSQFALSETTLPMQVPVNGTATLNVVFTPTVSGTVSDFIYIHSDASNIPSLAIKLTGTGQYIPPNMVQDVEVNIEGDDVIITWQAVTETIDGTPITPDLYIVLYNETPYEDENYYYYLTSTAELSAVHTRVALFRDSMFYRVVAVKFYREGEGDALASLNTSKEKILWSELKTRLVNARDKK